VLTLVLDFCYCLLVLLALPMVLWKRIRTGKYRSGWNQKLRGQLPRRTDFQHPLCWLHAVSVGEVLQLRQVVEQIRAIRPDLQVMISTTTETGYAVAIEKFPGCQVAFFPLDFSGTVRAALDRVQPDLIVLVELELWPNFILAARNRNIPLALINGRLSQRSFRGYRRIRPLVQKLLACFSLIAVQTEEYRTRFLQLGALPEITLVTGSIKFDGVSSNENNPLTPTLREWLQLAPEALVFVAGSTQAPEEQMALRVYRTLKNEFPELRLVLVPRHPERGGDLVELIHQEGFSVWQRSSKQFLPVPMPLRSGQEPESAGDAIGLLDTVGELGACWGLADVAFVGGSFTSRGGQNMLEPAAFGAAVCFGPNTWNFKQIVELLLAHEAARRVHSQQELEEFVRTMLREKPLAFELGARAREFVLSQQGATRRTLQALLPLCYPCSGKRSSQAA